MSLLWPVPRKEDIASGEAKLESLTQELKELQYTLGQYELKAPQDGVIRSRLLEVGGYGFPAETGLSNFPQHKKMGPRLCQGI